MTIHISKTEFLAHTQQLLQKIATSGESAFVLDEGRMIAELRPHIPPRADKVTGPAGTAVLYSADDIVSPLEPDGYEPFK